MLSHLPEFEEEVTGAITRKLEGHGVLSLAALAKLSIRQMFDIGLKVVEINDIENALRKFR